MEADRHCVLLQQLVFDGGGGGLVVAVGHAEAEVEGGDVGDGGGGGAVTGGAGRGGGSVAQEPAVRRVISLKLRRTRQKISFLQNIILQEAVAFVEAPIVICGVAEIVFRTIGSRVRLDGPVRATVLELDASALVDGAHAGREGVRRQERGAASVNVVGCQAVFGCLVAHVHALAVLRARRVVDVHMGEIGQMLLGKVQGLVRLRVVGKDR